MKSKLSFGSFVLFVISAFALAGCGGGETADGSGQAARALTAPLTLPPETDPGTGPWPAVPDAQVGTLCQLDSALLKTADGILQKAWAVVRHGRLCHEYYPSGNPNATSPAWSATKTLGGLTMGMIAYETRSMTRTGRKTGPLADTDRVDQWLDSFTFNKDALLAHVLAMEAHNKDLSFGHKRFSYDALGTGEINRLSDIMNVAMAQDAGRLGSDLDAFVKKFVLGRLGMASSTWPGKPNKILAYSWNTNVRDMARVGLLMLNHGRWAGEQLLSEDWVYLMSHPSFEDASTGYGYLTWMNSLSNWTDLIGVKKQGPTDGCAPTAQYPSYPHQPSGAPNCGYKAPYACGQTYDDGIFWASGLGGQLIIVHRGLDMVLVIKDFGDNHDVNDIWNAVRPALLAYDPMYTGNDAAFCAAYSSGKYAPDLR